MPHFDSESRHTVLKSINAEDRSIYIMKAGCQQLFRHAVPESEDSGCGGRWVLSFRKTIDGDSIEDRDGIGSPMAASYKSNEISFDIGKPLNVLKENVSLVFGASIINGLDSNRLAKGTNKCFVYAEGGRRISQISKVLDEVYEEHRDNNVVKVFVSTGVNDIRYCRNGIFHLRSQLNHLITKIHTYFPHAKVYFQSILPVHIENNFTVINILNFNKMLFEVCVSRRCYYLNVFNLFLSHWGNARNMRLYSDRVHLNKRGLAILARVYILHINKERFNPVI